MADEFDDIQAAALRLLTRREHSRRELFNKLTARGFAARPVDAVLEQLSEQGWLDDRRFAESYARQRIQKGYGPMRVAYELRQAGIDDFDLDQMADEISGGWLALLIRVYEKKYTHETMLTANEWAKRARFLAQRGFTGSLITALFERLQLKFE